MPTYNTTPYEIMGGPFEAWLAAVGTSFPVVDANPSGSWTKLGTGGALNYDEEGVKVKKSRSIKLWRSLASAAPIKGFLESEAVQVMFNVKDLTAEVLAYALGNAVTTVAAGSGTAGYKSITLESGLIVTQYALLLRGPSAHFDGRGQLEIPIVIQVGEWETAFVKGQPAGLAFTFEALRHSSLGLGLWKQQTAAAL